MSNPIIMFSILIIVCVPGIISIIPAFNVLYDRINERRPASIMVPSRKLFIIISIMQALAMVSLASGIGVLFSHQTNLHAPLFQAMSGHEELWPALSPQILPAITVGVIGPIIFLFMYYLIFIRLIDDYTFNCMESLRNSTGFWGRILYGGIVEEVLCRWGLLSLLVWVGITLTGEHSQKISWMAILLSGLLFGLGHLPGYIAYGCKKTYIFIVSVLILNLWASLIFGWLFWCYGLSGAIIAHIIFHVIWYPMDYKFRINVIRVNT